MNETQRLTIRNTLLADKDLEALDAAYSTAVSHLLRPVIDNMIGAETFPLKDLIRMLVGPDEGTLLGGDGDEHALLMEADGDGWNEPESESYLCACGKWEGYEWVQRDPQRSGRPDVVEIGLRWRQHVLDTYPIELEDTHSEDLFLAGGA